MRGLLILAVLVLLLVVVWSLRGAATRRSAGPAVRHDRLVKDPVCRTYVVTGRAVQRQVGGGVQYFCSQQCADRYQSGGDRGPAGHLGEGRA